VNLQVLTTKLFSHPRWPLYLVLIISVASQVFTAVMNTINSLIWWKRIDLDLILIGCIDSLAVTLLIAPAAIYLIRHSFNLEEMNRNLQKEIAERTQAETALRESEENYRQLFEAESDAIFLVDNQTDRILQANQAACALYGYSREELLGMKNADLSAEPEQTQKVTRETPIIPDQVVTIPLRWHRKKDGNRFPVEISGRFFVLKDRPVHIAAMRDISRRMASEEALRENETRLRILSDSLPGGLVYQIDSGEEGGLRRFTYISGGVEMLHGFSVEEVLEDAQKIYGQVIEEDIPLIAEREALAFADMKTFSAEARIRMPSGEVRWRLFTSAPRRLANNHLVWDGIEIDITEQKRMEEERMVMSKLESTGILAGGIAHDFNNLLSVIIGNIDQLEAFDQNREEMANSLKEVKKAALEARGLTKQFITFSQGGDPIKKPTSLTHLLQEQVPFTLRGSAIKWEMSLSPDLWVAEVDEIQMGQVIRNIVLNAREAMPEGGRVSVSAQNVELNEPTYPSLPPGPYIKMRFTDQGEGIPEDILPKIFDPYFSTKQRGNQKGMGLGLTICRSIIQKHGGTISLDSQWGRGTTLDIYLPALPEAASIITTAKEVLPGRPRILVMDDEEMVRTMAGTILDRLGYQVELVENGQKAIEVFQTAKEHGQPFGAVLLDLTVRGGLGGKEAIKELLKIDPQVKSIVSSGYDEDPVMQQYEQYGFRAALTKPYLISDLKEVLAKLFPKAESTN